MNLVELEAFFPDIEPELPRCPVPVIENRIRDTIIDACERANIWRWDHPEIFIRAGVQSYDLAAPTSDTLIHSVLQLNKNGRPIDDFNTVFRHEGFRSQHRGYSVGERGNIFLTTNPKKSTPPLPVFVDPDSIDRTLPDVLDQPVDPGPISAGGGDPSDLGLFRSALVSGFGETVFALTTEFPFVFNGATFDLEITQEVLDSLSARTPDIVTFAEIPYNENQIPVENIPTTNLQQGFDTLQSDDPVFVLGDILRIQFNTGSNWQLLGVNILTPGVTQEDIDAYTTALAAYNDSVAANLIAAQQIASIDATNAAYPSLLENREHGLEPVLSIKPSRTTLCVDEVLWRDYYDLIVMGTLFRGLMMRGRPWSDPAQGKDFQYKYELALAKARQGIDRGFKTGSQRFRPRKFA